MLRAYLNPKILELDGARKYGDRVWEVLGVNQITVGADGVYVELGLEIPPRLQIHPVLIPWVQSFSCQGDVATAKLLDRTMGLHERKSAWINLSPLPNSVCRRISGGAEQYNDLFILYWQVMGGKSWPSPGKDMTAEQCRKPILQVRYHLREAMRITIDRAKAWFRRLWQKNEGKVIIGLFGVLFALWILWIIFGPRLFE